MKLQSYKKYVAIVFLLFSSILAVAQLQPLFLQPADEPAGSASDSNNLPGFKAGDIVNDGFLHEDPSIPHFLPLSGVCFPGTTNRFTGSWHSNLYIGNNNGANVLLAWGQLMLNYTGTGAGNITSPATVSAASYAGVPLEVRSCSSGGATGESVMVMRSTTDLYVFGTAVNIAAITTYPGFGGIAINTAASNVTAKLPAGVLITDIISVAVSQTALAIVTTTGNVYVLTTVLNLQGDNGAVSTPAVWHHVTLSGGVTFLTGVIKLSLSSSGAFALTATNKIYYWGSPANVAGVANTTTAYKYAFDMSAQIPAATTVTDLVCLGTKVPSPSTLFLLCSNKKVYGCGLNTGGCLGINNVTVTFNQATFITVKGTDGVTDLANIVKIDGDTESDVFCIAAMNTSGQIYGWGDSPAGMLGVNAATGSFAVPKTVQLFLGTAPGTGYTEFSVSGHFIVAFYVNGTTDQYWYLGHNIGGSVGDPTNVTTFILAATPAPLNAPVGVSFDCSNVIVPITWLSFTAQKKETGVLLNWGTATEQNTIDFLVQHSVDGNSWQTISIVLSVGNSSTNQYYSDIDLNPANGINYYRLLQRDIDGKSSYSKTVSILFSSKTKQLIISPTGVVNGVLEVQLQEAAMITLFNSMGQLILTKNLPAGKQYLPVGNLGKGVYMLKAGNEMMKFIIQ